MSENVFNHAQAIKQAEADSKGYDINQHANETIGPVDVKQVIASIAGHQTTPEREENFIPAPINKHDAEEQRHEKYRIPLNNPYNIINSEVTNDGVRVYVDNYPTQKVTTEADKQFWEKHYGDITGLLGGAAGLIVSAPALGGAIASRSGLKIGSEALGVFGKTATGNTLANGLGGWAAGKIIDTFNPSMPVLERNGVRYIKITP